MRKNWMRVVVFVVCILCLAGCNAGNVFSGISMEGLQSTLQQMQKRGEVNRQQAIDAVKVFWDDASEFFQNKLSSASLWQPAKTEEPVFVKGEEDVPAPTRPQPAPRYPVFDKELGQYEAWNEPYMVGEEKRYAACISTYTTDVQAIQNAIKEAFTETFFYEPVCFLQVECEGFFCVDGQDGVQVFRCYIMDTSVPVLQNRLEEIFEMVQEDGSVILGYYILGAEWDDYLEYRTTDEFLARREKMVERMAEITGASTDEIYRCEPGFDFCFMFIPEVRELVPDIPYGVCLITVEYRPPENSNA